MANSSNLMKFNKHKFP